VVSVKTAVFWVVALCSLVEVYRRFRDSKTEDDHFVFQNLYNVDYEHLYPDLLEGSCYNKESEHFAYYS
jgi:hypothetical protein